MAQAPDLGRAGLMATGVPDLPSWWSGGGAAGWVPSVWLSANAPWSLAGHTVGSWSVEEGPRAPQALVFPGIRGVQTPLAGFDSIEVASGEGGGWQGFGATLATARPIRIPAPGRQTRSFLDLRNGSFGYDENALMIEREDPSRWMMVEVLSGNRDFVEGLAGSGRHSWGLAGTNRRGPYVVEGAFAQRGTAAGLVNSEEESLAGESWKAGLRYKHRLGEAALRLARTQERGESHGESDFSRREAGATSLEGELAGVVAGGDLGLRAEYRKSHVVRNAGSATELFDRSARLAWAAARWDRALGTGQARLELGAGHHDPFAGVVFAPAASYRIESGTFSGRVGFERVLDPVWTDLAPSVTPFVQRTWAGVFEVRTTLPAAVSARAMFLFGRTEDRALVARVPLQDLWLRLGIRRDREPYDFGLLWWSGAREDGRFGLGADGFLLSRTESADAPLVDPKYGFRSWASVGFAAFTGELRVRLRAELEGVGERENEPDVPPGCAAALEDIPLVSPAYVTSGAAAILNIGMVVLTIRARNLENASHLETWVDCATGLLARGPGREFRFGLTARIFD